MKKSYRIELLNEKTGKQRLFGYFYTTLENIQKAMENNVINHPTVLIYCKTGTKVIKSFQG